LSLTVLLVNDDSLTVLILYLYIVLYILLYR
jgi:hypothetical protein